MMNTAARQIQSSPSIYNDLNSLDKIRKQAKDDQHAAIKAAAKEFEAFFMNMMLKSMRQASEVIGEDSMFSSQQEKMFVGMLDEQLSVELSQKGNLGIAELLTRDLLGEDLSKKPVQSISEFLPRTHREKQAEAEIQIQSVGEANNHKPYEKYENKLDSLSNQTVGGITDPILQTHRYEAVTPAVNRINQSNYLEKVSAASLQLDNAVSQNSTQLGVNQLAEKKSLFENAQSFIKKLLPTAKKIASKLGVDPKLLVAQAALETGWGKYIMHDASGKPSYNLFGIKDSDGWSGDSVKANTLEVEQGTFVKRQQHFRMYESFEQSFVDYVEFVKSSPRYQQALDAVENAKSYIKALQQSGYATDPNYADKVINIYENGVKPFTASE